jgi:transposase-like protein
MSTKTKKSAATGVRYSDTQKKEVVDFVFQYNSKKGRGGQSAASAKFKVSPLTIAGWIKAAGAPVKKSDKVAAPDKAAAQVAAAPAPVKAAKPAKKVAKSSSKSGRRSRYTPEQKQEIIDCVSTFNATNGRGGQSKAVAKYKVSAITLATWLKAAGVPTGKGAVKLKKSAKAPKAVKSPKAAKAVKAAKATATPAGLTAKVSALIDLNAQVLKAETELEKLYAKYDSLMASLKV